MLYKPEVKYKHVGFNSWCLHLKNRANLYFNMADTTKLVFASQGDRTAPMLLGVLV